MPRPLLLGHRGARATHSVPENSLASFDLALAHGCDGFEFDVRRTGDGRAVICHDPKFRDIEIANAGAGDVPDLPLLDDVLGRYQESAFLDIEIKVPGLEDAVLGSLRMHPPRRGSVVSSFLPEVLRIFREDDPSLPLGLICETESQLAAWTTMPLQFVIPHYALMSIDLCREVHAASSQVLTWTVNRKSDMVRLLEMGVDGIISDDTKAVASLRD